MTAQWTKDLMRAACNHQTACIQLDVLIAVPLGAVLLVGRLKLREVDAVAEQAPDAAKASAELAALLQWQQGMHCDGLSCWLLFDATFRTACMEPQQQHRVLW